MIDPSPDETEYRKYPNECKVCGKPTNGEPCKECYPCAMCGKAAVDGQSLCQEHLESLHGLDSFEPPCMDDI